MNELASLSDAEICKNKFYLSPKSWKNPEFGIRLVIDIKAKQPGVKTIRTFRTFSKLTYFMEHLVFEDTYGLFVNVYPKIINSIKMGGFFFVGIGNFFRQIEWDTR